VAVAREKGLQATSLRVGQVCGSEKGGAWNTSDWLPALVKSSLTMGMLPDCKGVSDACSELIMNALID
jgi:thioester reductase-like protein